MSNSLGLYIHIPFCHSKCPYCDFFSVRCKNSDFNEYIDSLKSNIDYWSKSVNKKVETIYFGGGTPSVIGADLLCEILDYIKSKFNVSQDAEITFEVNPNSGRFFDFNKVYADGFNRVSVGLQSGNDNELKQLGRTHSAFDAINTIKLIKESGITNISLDLMMGIPEQTTESLKRSIDFCIEQGVTHISAYILKLEEGTVFYKKQDKLNLPDDDYVAKLYLYAVDYLRQNGFNQYEISNFSLKNYESKHNLKYWNLENYLGIGPGAHSFIDNKRFYYEPDFDKFKNNVIVQDGIGGNEEEYIMLKLRLTKGLNADEYRKVFGKEFTKDFKNKVEFYENIGLMINDNNFISFTPKGFLLSNTILADLI